MELTLTESRWSDESPCTDFVFLRVAEADPAAKIAGVQSMRQEPQHNVPITGHHHTAHILRLGGLKVETVFWGEM